MFAGEQEEEQKMKMLYILRVQKGISFTQNFSQNKEHLVNP